MTYLLESWDTRVCEVYDALTSTDRLKLGRILAKRWFCQGVRKRAKLWHQQQREDPVIHRH